MDDIRLDAMKITLGELNHMSIQKGALETFLGFMWRRRIAGLPLLEAAKMQLQDFDALRVQYSQQVRELMETRCIAEQALQRCSKLEAELREAKSDG